MAHDGFQALELETCQEQKKVPPKNQVAAAVTPGTIFHEPWWLEATTAGQYREVTVENGGRVVGRLPFVLSKKAGLTVSKMPPFTHVLGAAVEAGNGKPQTQLLQRLSTVRELIGKLPPSAYFVQAFESSLDGLAFQERGYQLTPQYTFEVDCRDSLDNLLAGMHFKTRQHIRRAEEKFTVNRVNDAYEFMGFYLGNLKKTGAKSYIDWTTFPELFRQCMARGSGEAIAARWADGRCAAMVFLVWGKGKMYYLLSTRAGDEGDNGSINLLIWEGMKRAHERGLLFDLDGVTTSGTARFLSGFNGSPKLRMIVRKTNRTYSAMQLAKRQLLGYRRETVSFT
jgi:Acetyltransferase (GNAT) domain